MSINFSNLSKKIEFVHFSKISRGNGKELKYLVKDKDMNRYLFKINSIIKLNNKVNEFRFAKRIEHLPFEKSEIVDLCVFDSNRYICSIYKWIDGKIRFQRWSTVVLWRRRNGWTDKTFVPQPA